MWSISWDTRYSSADLHNITAVATDNSNLTATSSPATVINLLPPQVDITSPANNYIAGQGWQIIFTASATVGTPLTVMCVDFYDGATDLGSGIQVAGAWVYTWDTSTADFGTHSLKAKVTDSAGFTGTSDVVNVTIRLPGDGTGDNVVDGLDYGVWQNGYQQPGASFETGDYNGDGVVDGLDYGIWQEHYNDIVGAPSLTLTAPANEFIGGQGWQITLSATTTDGFAGTVTGVMFVLDGTDMDQGTENPPTNGVYTYKWDTSSASFGTHFLTARLTDSSGSTSWSTNFVIVHIRLPGDGNGDLVVDGLDYGLWQNGYQQPGANTFDKGDYNGDGFCDGLDYGVWQNNYNKTLIISSDVPSVAASQADAGSIPMTGGSAPQLIAVTPAAATVALVFDSDVVVSAGAVEVTNLAGATQACTSAYDAASRTLTLTFAAALPADSYTVRVIGSFVVAANGGAALDGAASGVSGSNAQVQFSAE